MPDTLQKSLSLALSEVRACFEDLRALGLYELHGLDLSDLAPCPPGVIGIDRGGASSCRQETLVEIRAELGDCQRCPLSRGRSQVVFGQGNPHARLVVIAEFPGKEEDERGALLHGDAGELFERMLLAIGLHRDEIYLASAVMCRTPQNRLPNPTESAICGAYLARQLAAIHPAVIVTLGEFAVQTLTGATLPLAQLRGRWLEYQGMPLLPTLHPAHLLRHPADKRLAWEDLKQVLRKLRAAE